MKLTELYGFEKKAKKLSTADLKKFIVEALNEKADPVTRFVYAGALFNVFQTNFTPCR